MSEEKDRSVGTDEDEFRKAVNERYTELFNELWPKFHDSMMDKVMTLRKEFLGEGEEWILESDWEKFMTQLIPTVANEILLQTVSFCSSLQAELEATNTVTGSLADKVVELEEKMAGDVVLDDEFDPFGVGK